MGALRNLRALAFLLSLVISAVVAAPHTNLDLFSKWLLHHKHSYPSHQMDQRHKNFAATLTRLEAANRTEMPNALAGMSVDEFHSRNSLLPVDPTVAAQFVAEQAAELVTSAPDNWNWRDKQACTPVRSHHLCTVGGGMHLQPDPPR